MCLLSLSIHSLGFANMFKVPIYVLYLSVYNLVGTIQTALLVQSLSNFTCKFWMMRGQTLLISVIIPPANEV